MTVSGQYFINVCHLARDFIPLITLVIDITDSGKSFLHVMRFFFGATEYFVLQKAKVSFTHSLCGKKTHPSGFNCNIILTFV